MKNSNSDFRVLVVDDEQPLVLLLTRILKKEGYSVRGAYNGEEALVIFKEFSPNLVISDLKMPGMNGIELMKEIKDRDSHCDVIILTAFGSVENAVAAMKGGAIDYLIKPLKDPEELRMAVKKVVERQQLLATNTLWQEQLTHGLPPTNVVFAGMEDVWKQVQQVATTDATVLLLGESGTGKSLIAKVIHQLSGKKGAFVELNCAAMPETLIESELFGHEKGAFTGAVKTKRGKFELAQDGTIFLDEIGEMPLASQAKLLRVLQEKAFERVGGTSTITTNARIIAATNQNLQERIDQKMFREDLFYRLSVFPIHLPPLRERKEGIEQIATHLVRTICSKTGKHIEGISSEAMEKIRNYGWPGNIREMFNTIERAIILSAPDERVIGPEKLAFMKEEQNGTEETERYSDIRPAELKSLEDIEKEAIERTLKETRGHRKKTAEILGISLRTLQYKLKKYAIPKQHES